MSKLLFATLLALGTSSAVAAEGRPCEPEPTNMLIGYGDVLNSPECEIAPAGDSDLFRFQGFVGERVRLTVVAVTPAPVTPCADVFDPDGVSVDGRRCSSNISFYLTLATTGIHTLLVSELGNDNLLSYAVALERIQPVSPAAVQIKFGEVLVDEISPPPDMDSYHFFALSGDVVQVVVAPNGPLGATTPCAEVFDPSGVSLGGKKCSSSVTFDLSLDSSGEHVVLVSELADDNTFPYTIGLQCITGECPDAPPPPTAPCASSVRTLAELRVEIASLELSGFTGSSVDRLLDKIGSALDNGENERARTLLSRLGSTLVRISNLAIENPRRVDPTDANPAICGIANVLVQIPLQ